MVRTIFLFFLLIPANSILNASEPSASFILSGFQESRERLQSGIYQVTGTMISEDPVWGKLEGKVRLEGMFDFEKNRTRFEREEPCRIYSTHQESLSDKKWTAGVQGGKFVRTAERTITWLLTPNLSTAIIGPPAVKPPAQISPWDVRLLGICFLNDLQRQSSFSTILNAYSQDVTTVKRIAKEIYRVEWDKNGAKVLIDFDESKGYLPVLIEVRHGGPSELLPSATPKAMSTVTWTNQSGIWVPEKFFTREGDPISGLMKSYDLTFTWKQVNDPIPDDVFKLRQLNLPNKTPVVSNETGRSISLGRIGDKRYLSEEESNDERSISLHQRWINGGISTVILVLVFTYWIFKKKETNRINN